MIKKILAYFSLSLSTTYLIILFVTSSHLLNWFQTGQIYSVDQTKIIHEVKIYGVPVDLISFILVIMFMSSVFYLTKHGLATIFFTILLVMVLPVLVYFFDPSEYDKQVIGILYDTPLSFITNEFTLLVCGILLFFIAIYGRRSRPIS